MTDLLMQWRVVACQPVGDVDNALLGYWRA
jgi:hypothetical protein